MVMCRGGVSTQISSLKQQINTRLLTETEMVGIGNFLMMVLWAQLFLGKQGYIILNNLLPRDSQSTILMEPNGRRTAGESSRYMNIWNAFIADNVDQGEAEMQHCWTALMLADFLKKLLQGTKFKQFRENILGM